MEDSWIILIVFLVMCLEIVFFWWLFACDGWVKLQKFGDNFWYTPKHIRKVETRLEKQMRYVDFMLAKSRGQGFAVDGHAFCRCSLKAEIASKETKFWR